jgi:solute carrier family 25 iron transporter 28/37
VCAEFELDPSMPVHKAMIAGATAGVMEHCFMYPVDTVKSILQAEEGSARRSISEVCPIVLYRFESLYALCSLSNQVIRSERIWRLYRGIGAVALGAIPSHAANFATYETVKNALGGNREVC